MFHKIHKKVKNAPAFQSSLVVSINGEFYARPVTGIERVARNVTKYLDRFAGGGIKFELVVPKNAVDVPKFTNIAVVKLSVDAKFFPRWTQVDYARYVWRNKRLSLDFTNVCPYFWPGVAYIHDIYAVIFGADYKRNFHQRLVAFYSRLMYRRIAKKAKLVVTVSQFSKRTIIEKYHIKSERVVVVGAGYEKSKDFDDSIFEKLAQNGEPLQKGTYYFTLGSLSARKNIAWIVEHAKLYGTEHFVISGKALPNSEGVGEIPKNITLAGYLSDAQVHSLMRECKAFLFPSRFEGFGIPPLEALSYGAKVIISNAASLPEIYGECAHYIDCEDPSMNLDEVLSQKVSPPDELLKRFTLENSAKKLYDAIVAVVKK